jgi:hypothetical protein
MSAIVCWPLKFHILHSTAMASPEVLEVIGCDDGLTVCWLAESRAADAETDGVSADGVSVTREAPGAQL